MRARMYGGVRGRELAAPSYSIEKLIFGLSSLSTMEQYTAHLFL